MQSGAVEVWTARPVELGCGACEDLAAVLDAGERERAARLRFEPDRRAFVVSHAMRRIALGLALATDPHELRFGSGPHGQPVLLGVAAGALAFSLSRSRDLVACALSAGGPVGVDVEALRDGVDAALLEPYMSLPAQEGPMALEAFYVRWTALEAFWKARGLGLSRTHPRIALEPCGDGSFDVRCGGHATALRTVRLPAPSTHVLSVACEPVESLRIVALEGLAGRPRARPQERLSSCKDGHCGVAGDPKIFSE